MPHIIYNDGYGASSKDRNAYNECRATGRRIICYIYTYVCVCVIDINTLYMKIIRLLTCITNFKLQNFFLKSSHYYLRQSYNISNFAYVSRSRKK